MGLQLEIRQTGYGTLQTSLAAAVQSGGNAPGAAGRSDSRAAEKVVAWHR